jgi:xylulokinase
LLSDVDPSDIRRFAPGWPAPGYMGLTLMWLRQHKPDLLRQTHRVLLPKDYVRFYLTDELCTDPSDAAATWLFDVETGAWSEHLMQWCGVAGHLLPPVVPSWESAGALTKVPPSYRGLRAGIPVAAGAADCAAQMLDMAL